MSQVASALADFLEQMGRYPESLSELVGGPWFSHARAFTDFCGNPYSYRVRDAGRGIQEYRLQAFGCDGIPNTDLSEYSLFSFFADNQGHHTAPVPWGFAHSWPGVFD